MVNITMVVTREHEVVKVMEYQVAEELRAAAEKIEGVPFQMGEPYEGCIGEIVGVL